MEVENVGNGQVRDEFVTQAQLFEPHPTDGEVLWKSVHGVCIYVCMYVCVVGAIGEVIKSHLRNMIRILF